MNYTIVDTREPADYARSHVNAAVNIPTAEFMTGSVPTKLVNVPKGSPVILYCISGQRSNTCIMILRQYGFTNLTNGINEAQTRRLLERKYSAS